MKDPNLLLGKNPILCRLFPAAPALGLAALLAASQTMMQAASFTWNVASGNWSTPSSWTPATGAGGPLGTDAVIFGNAGASSSPSTINNTVDLGFAGTVTNLTVNSAAVGTYIYDVTQIPSGQTLIVSSNMLVGGVNQSSAYATFEYMVGAGTLEVTGPSLIVQNYGSASGANCCAYLNLSGLNTFIYDNPNGTIAMAGFVPSNYASGSQGTRQGGSMFLAANSNNITASSINLGTSAVAQAGPSGSLASGVASQLTLGPGTNLINVANFNISAQKNPFTVTNSGGGLRIRGKTGADSDSAVNITIGNRNVGGGSGTTAGNLLLNGCAVDIKAGTLTVGQNTGGTPNSSGDAGNGVLQFDTGTVSANSLLMAYNTSANYSASVLAQCNGTIQVGPNGTLLIGAGQLFALATAAASGPSTGNLIISNGLVNCQGPITMGTNVGTLNGTITFLTGGTLNMGPGSYIGTLASPVTTLTLTNCTLSVSIPSVNYTNICVQNLNWPVPDTNLTITVAAMPVGINPGAVFPFLNFTTMNGTFNSPNLVLPPGVQGYLSLAPGGNTINLNITGGVGPGTGGVQLLLNSSFGSNPAGTNWTAVGGTAVVSTNSTYPNTGSCTVDARPIQALFGSNVGKLTGSFVAGGSTNAWSQNVAAAPGSAITAGAFAYVAHEDIMSGNDSFRFEVDFYNSNGVLIGAYESSIVTNLTCGETTPFPLDTWSLLAITNQMQVVGGINTGVVVSNIAAVITVPPGTATTTFKAVLIQPNAINTGSVYISGANLGLIGLPVPPSLSAVSPNLITLCTNTTLTCTATSSITTISSLQVIVTSATLGALTNSTVTNTVGSAGLTVTGLGTSSASLSLALSTNTIYKSVVVEATDADGVTVASPSAAFDTLVPTLVIEASDFNYSSGQFLDTPANGGLALYQGQVGTGGVDENKATRTATQSYYRPSDAVIMQNANPGSGTPPTATEQKFVTAAANGDTTDVEQEVGYNSPGDWLNYTRTFGPGGSAPAGTYNVWCYLATSGTGVQTTFSQLTSDRTQGSQTTNFLGSFGTAAFSDNGYNNFVFVPLMDQFGNLVTVTITNGQQTFKSTVVGNPNLGFYMLLPVAPVYTPQLLHAYPDGTASGEQSTNHFTFTIGPAQGAAITANGIQLLVNGVDVSSELSLSHAGGIWTASLPIQSNLLYTAVINVTNTSGDASTYSLSFDTLSLNNFQWEAVDYDFSTNDGTAWHSGLFIDNAMPTGDTAAPGSPLALNSYFGYPTDFLPSSDPAGIGAVALQGVDINYLNTSGLASIYRADTIPGLQSAPVVGSQIASDTLNGGLRYQFLVAQTNTGDSLICEFNIGWFNAGDWLNYTRTYPAGKFNVWGRLAGGAGAFSGTTLGLVTSGVGTSNQTVQVFRLLRRCGASGMADLSLDSVGGYQRRSSRRLAGRSGHLATDKRRQP